MATSPTVMAPRSAVGSGIGFWSPPQNTWISCSATIRPPVVIRICFRCWPYTGMMMTRSKAQPRRPVPTIATSMARPSAARFRASKSACIQPASGISVVMAR